MTGSPSAAPKRLQPLLLAAGMLWNLPNSLLGLMGGLAGLGFGARAYWSRRDLALIFNHWPWGPGGAITLGNVILHTAGDLDCDCVTYAHAAGLGAQPRIRMADHERAHVYQAMVLGPLFLPMYLLCGGVSHRNRFEQAADHYALTGRGWWPWPRRQWVEESASSPPPPHER